MAVKFDNEAYALRTQEFRMPMGERVGGRESRVNPIEEAGTLLVEELRRVGWDMPGLDVQFRTTGRGKALTRMLRSVSGETEEGPFRLSFHGCTGELRGGSYMCTQLDHAVVPPGLDVHYYSDGSGPTVEMMVGSDYRADGKLFMEGWRVNPKLRGEPKTYLKYSGRGRGGGEGDYGPIPHDSDLGREHDPEGDEPRSLSGTEVARRVNDFVMGLVLRLRELPSAPGHDDVTAEGDANLRRLARVEAIPAPDGFPTLYCRVKRIDLHRGALPGRHGDERGPEQDYVLSGSGKRLLDLGVRTSGKGLHERVQDGFCFATDDPTSGRGHAAWDIGHSDTVVFEVRPKHLNDIYVVDNAVYERVRAELGERAVAEGRDRFSDAEVDQFMVAYGRTMVPAAEYDGSYAEPVYLIGRQMDGEEARLMRGRIDVTRSRDGVVTVMRDEVSNEPVVFYEADAANLYHLRSAVRAARDASELLRVKVRVDPDLEAELLAREAVHRAQHPNAFG